MIKERIKQLQNLMKQEGIDAYLIPTSDFHGSEYVGEYFQVRKYMSGFRGSAGTLLVFQDHAGLFTDSRYHIIARDQLVGSSIELFKSGEEGVPELKDYLKEQIRENGVLAFDGRTLTNHFGKILEKELKEKKVTLKYDKDLVDQIWNDRPALSAEPAFLLDISYTGSSTKEKLKNLRETMKEKQASLHLLTSLDDIAWLFNVRGHDILNNPVILAYAVISLESAYLFLNETILNAEILASFKENQIELRPYNSIYEYIKTISENETILLNPKRVNYAIMRSLPELIKKIEEEDPTTLAKSIKNPVELNHLRNCHIKDGVAVTKFMYWLKHQVGKETITEITAADHLENLRKEQEGFLEPSFETIAGYAAHGAIIHYGASKETDIPLKPENLFLVDSGGQYYDGTTDITRTFILGKVTEEQKFHYTTVVQSALALSNANFLHGCTGVNLDMISRMPFWKHSLDFKHGTGHGVGFLLNVHEGPQRFHWKAVTQGTETLFEEGMTITDEPGFYLEGKYGIRIENELICVKKEKNEFGQFMGFEIMTYAPIDLDGIDTKYMMPDEIKALNDYHAMVYEKIAPHLNEEEKTWLKEYTRPLS